MPNIIINKRLQIVDDLHYNHNSLVMVDLIQPYTKKTLAYGSFHINHNKKEVTSLGFNLLNNDLNPNELYRSAINLLRNELAIKDDYRLFKEEIIKNKSGITVEDYLTPVKPL